jgi:hypothetical protein
MVRQILPNNNEKYYRNFSPKNFTSKHALKDSTVPVPAVNCAVWILKKQATLVQVHKRPRL